VNERLIVADAETTVRSEAAELTRLIDEERKSKHWQERRKTRPKKRRRGVEERSR